MVTTRIHRLPLLALIGLATVLAATSASANSRFTVKNTGSQKVLINIFNGDDDLCIAESKHHTVGAGNEQSMGCEGGGKDHCKVRVSIEKDQVCLGENDGCGDNAVVLPNHATLTVPEGGESCKITE